MLPGRAMGMGRSTRVPADARRSDPPAPTSHGSEWAPDGVMGRVTVRGAVTAPSESTSD
jgi:hypothetical protein